MRHSRLGGVVVIAWACLALSAGGALAQTNATITGQVADATGGVLPGVTVEASSPALIEGSRVVFSDGQGRYRIIDLRPGTYTLTFTLSGFSSVVREGLQLTGAMVFTVDAEMRVGSIEESITVSGANPVVDVQQATRVQTISRDVMDSVPTARNIQTIGALIPGVKISTPDVGAGRSMEQVYMTVHGTGARDVTVEMDGMKVNGLMVDGTRQTYHNDAMLAELNYQTSGISAETSSGGVRLSMIPREGGNQLSGGAYVGGSDGSWQSSNITDELRAKGLNVGTGTDHISDVNLSIGGPIVRDHLWFFTSGRMMAVTELVADAYFRAPNQPMRTVKPPVPDLSRQAYTPKYVRNATQRLTWQATPRNKVAAYLDRIWKQTNYEQGARTDPETASRLRKPVIYYTGQAKWTSTASAKLLLEAGYSSHVQNLSQEYQPGIRQQRPADVRPCLATPCNWEPAYILSQTGPWYAQAGSSDLLTGNSWNASGLEYWQYPTRFVVAGSANYVTGSHAFKAGVSWDYGPERYIYGANGDLNQQYRNGVPAFVVVRNTPTNSRTFVNADVGVYVQDSWTLDRLTLNPGVRFEWFRSEYSDQFAPAGRFVTARTFDKVGDLPKWFDVQPRFGLAYDLFGNARTALKFSIGRYAQGETTGFASRYNPMFQSTDTRTWTDRDMFGRNLPTNGDSIAQDNEIGPGTNQYFGLLQTRRPDENIKRVGSWLFDAGLQHELVPRVSVNVNYYRRWYYNLQITDNLLVDGSRDFTTVMLRAPNGEIVPVENLNRAKLGLVDELDTNTDDASDIYNGFEVGLTARLANGGSVFGGWTTERRLQNNCALYNDSRYSSGYRFCDDARYDVPFRHEYKLVAAHPMPFGFQASMSLQSYAGTEGRRTWNVPASAFTAVGAVRTRAVTVQLDEPGTRYRPRWNQVDVAVSRLWQIAGHRLEAFVNVYNLNNSSVVISENSEYGSAPNGDQRPTVIMQPRVLRLGAQWKF